MSIRPLAAPIVAPLASLPAVPVTLPSIPPPVDGPGGHVLTPSTLARRYESLAENIAAAAQKPNSEASQLATLANLRHLGLLSAQEHDDRVSSLRVQCRLHPAQLHGTGNTGLGVANQLWKVVHPARLCWGLAWNRFMRSDSLAIWLKLHLQVRQDASRPELITFHTDDNVQLSGVVIRAGGTAARKPMMLMVSGNASCAEAEFQIAQAHARAFDVNVMVYNPRGVGLSLGDVTHPDQSLLDCMAAIRKAGQYSDRLCVWGCSLGGALSTRALQILREAHDPVLKKLEYTICLNSFPSLPSIVGHVVTPRWLPARWGRGASSGTLGMMGIDSLETCRTLREHGVGVPGLVCNSTGDEMMHGPSSLAEALEEDPEALPRDLRVLQLDAGSHNAYPNYLAEPAYHEAISNWRGL